MSGFQAARAIADAVLYEGYVLYPYRASAKKNQARWQFGVLAPPAYASQGHGEVDHQVTEILAEAGDFASLRVRVRYLQLQQRAVEAPRGSRYRRVDRLEVGGELFVSFDETVERQVDATVLLADVDPGPATVSFQLPAGKEIEVLHDPDGHVVGRIVRRRWAVRGRVRVSSRRVPGPYRLWKVRVETANASPWQQAPVTRDVAMRRALLGAHTLLGLEDGRFVSLLDPPEFAKVVAAECSNEKTYPVLVGDPDRRDTVLSSPIILYDFPEIAAESPGEWFDGTEMDEMLALRAATLTDEEKREARRTDARVEAMMDRVDDLPMDVLERLHGRIREMRPVQSAPAAEAREWAVPEFRTSTEGTPEPGPGEFPEGTRRGTSGPAGGQAAPDGGGSSLGEIPGYDPSQPWWDPGNDAAVDPETDGVMVGGVRVAKGSKVMLRPGRRRADVHDLFLAGRSAEVAAVLSDVDGRHHIAVVLDDDPGADLHVWHGRYLYFGPDEVEPIGVEP